MTRICALLISLLLSQIHAQTAKLFSSHQISSFASMQVWSKANSYSVAGDPDYPDQYYVGGFLDLNSQLLSRLGVTGKGAFVMKSYTNGTIIWIKTFGGSEYNYCMFLMISGNDVIADFSSFGNFDQVLSSSPTEKVSSFIYSFRRSDGFIKWNTNLDYGEKTWVYALLEVENSFYASGYIMLQNGDYQAFVTKMDPLTGAQLWMDSFGGANYDYASALTSTGNQLVVMGTISGDLDGQPFTVPSSMTCFITWYWPNGTRDGRRTRLFGNPTDGCMVIAADYHSPTDSIYFAGMFTSPINPFSQQSIGFVGRIFASNQTLKYVKPFVDNVYYGAPSDQVFLPDGRWIVCGGTGVKLDNTNRLYGGKDMLLMSVNRDNGSVEWSFTWGTPDDDYNNFMFTNTDPTGEDQMIYMAGARIGMFEVAMLLTSVNMSALDRALPFRPYVPPSSTPDNNQPPVGAQVPANAAMVGGIVGGLVLIASGVVVALFMRRKRFPNSTATNFSNEAENFNNEITLVPINNDRTKEITSATAQISSIPVYGETTVVPTFMGIAIPGAYFIEELRSIRGRRLLFKNENCEIFIGEALSEAIRTRCCEQPVVIKRFLRMFDEKAKKSFIQELSLMYLFVENDLFVRLYGYHEQPYLMVMKYYAGGALEHFLFHKRPEDFVFSIEVKLKFIMQISRAISEMHKLGLAHADLKLLNVFVDISQKIEGGSKEYNCVLGDFGLSLIVDESQLLVRAYQVFNRRGLTMAYAAPEVIQRFKAGKPFLGWNPAVIKSGDLFAFSIIMFELLEEKRAWK